MKYALLFLLSMAALSLGGLQALAGGKGICTYPDPDDPTERPIQEPCPSDYEICTWMTPEGLSDGPEHEELALYQAPCVDAHGEWIPLNAPEPAPATPDKRHKKVARGPAQSKAGIQ